MADALICGAYTWGTNSRMDTFKPGVPQLLPWAAELLDSDSSPRNWPFVTLHANVARTIEGTILAATEAAAHAELADIVANHASGSVLSWQADGAAFPLTCEVKTAYVDPGEFTRRSRALESQGAMRVTVTLVTTPYWLGPETQQTPVACDTWPAGADAPVTIDEYAASNQNTVETLYSGSSVGHGQSFTGAGLSLEKATFLLSKTGSPTGNATAILYAHTGTFGTSSAPTGAALATSANFDVSTLTTSLAAVEFTFDGTYTPVDGTHYVIAVAYSGGDASNRVNVGSDTSAPTHGGNASTFNGSSWTTVEAEDLCFSVISDVGYAVGDTVFDGASGFWTCTTAHIPDAWATDSANWEAATVACISKGTPFVAFFPDTPGDVPALSRVRYYHDQATSKLALALHSNPAGGFSPIDDYSGSSDADAFGGAAASLTMTSTPTIIGTADSWDVAANAGNKRIFARVKSAAVTAANATMRFANSVAPAVGDAYSLYGTSIPTVTAASGGFDVLDLGTTEFPGGRVPSGTTGSVWTPETLSNSRTSETSVSFPGTTPSSYGSITTTQDRFRVEIEAQTLAAGGLNVHIFSGSAEVGVQTIYPSSAGYVFTSTGYFVIPSGTYTVKLSVPSGSVAVHGSNCNKKVYEQSVITIGATLGVQAACSESTKAVLLDVVAALPTDEACYVYTGARAAGEGIVIDLLSENDADHDTYVCDATDTGISVFSAVQPIGPFLLRPGTNALVGMAATPGTDPPGDGNLVVTYRPRYLLPYTGE